MMITMMMMMMMMMLATFFVGCVAQQKSLRAIIWLVDYWAMANAWEDVKRSSG